MLRRFGTEGSGTERRADGGLFARPRYRRRRYVLGMLIVVAMSAIVTTCVWHGQIQQLTTALRSHKAAKFTKGTLVPAPYGGTETILLVGNDQRKHTTTTPVLPHSNEMLLIRIDPNQPWISMMSLPRELQATFTGSNGVTYTNRLNMTMQVGGVNLTVKTITQITGVKINHVISIDFGNFERAINEMGCVYGQIDRRYYHVNTPGSAQYFQVNLYPGYQRLCGSQALQFVTYRHTDSALVRDQRDQIFLIGLKQEFGPSLISNIGKFENIFGQTVETDPGLHTTSGVANLVGTLVASAGKPVRQVPWQTSSTDDSQLCTCVTSTPQQVKSSVDSFLYGTYTSPNATLTTRLARNLHKPPAKHQSSAQADASIGVVPVPAPQLAAATAQARKMSFPLELPNIEVNNGDGFNLDLRNYSIDAPDGHAHPAYVGVFSTGLLGEYYDVEGTTWLNAPILWSPTDTINVAGRTYYLYYSGSHILQVAWFAHNTAYWVRNTLTYGLSNAQMLDIAEHTAPLIGVAAGSVRQDAKAQTAAPASVEVPSSGGTFHDIGLVGGIIALIASLGGIIVLVWQRFRITALRDESVEVAERIRTLERQLSAAGAVRGPVGGRAARHGQQAMPSEVTVYSGSRQVRRTKPDYSAERL